MSSKFEASVGECEVPMEREEQAEPDSTTCDSDDMAVGGQDTPDGRKCLTKEQLDIISNLVLIQEVYERFYEEELRAMTPFPTDEEPMYIPKLFLNVTEMTVFIIRHIFEFCKRVPGFETISLKDQIQLIIARCSDIFLLWTARKYDMETDSTITPYNTIFTREHHRRYFTGNSTDRIFNFFKAINILKPDDAEYALLAAFVIFTPQLSVLEGEKVRKQCRFYFEILESYIATNRPDDKEYFFKLLNLVIELREIGYKKIELQFSLTVKPGTGLHRSSNRYENCEIIRILLDRSEI